MARTRSSRKKKYYRMDVGSASQHGRTRLQGKPTRKSAGRYRKPVIALGLGIILATAAFGVWGYRHLVLRYEFSDVMNVPLKEVSTFEYPEDPAARSTHYGKYNGRRLQVVQIDDRHFDFILEPVSPHVAKVVFRNVDVSLMTPSVPQWCKEDEGLLRIALTDREWNRQQVWLQRDGEHVEVSGGDGFEEKRLVQAALAKNCLNAGLWEVILAVEEDGKKSMYYQGWFTFPMGQYKRLFEQNTGLEYADHWYGLEHWSDPTGTMINLAKLRRVYNERVIQATSDDDEPIIVAGEQLHKRRTAKLPNVVTWGDIREKPGIEFASFIPPGRYSVSNPWRHEYWRLAKFKKAILRDVTTPAGPERLNEVELVFTTRDGEVQRFIVGGIDLAALPQLPMARYPEGLYMPMGIGVPPFHQGYQDLRANPPHLSPYYSFLVDNENRWIDHHRAAIDGPVMHLDENDPSLLHVYLLSYERHSLIAHFQLQLKQGHSDTDLANHDDA